jgi:hypothetical protein
MSIQSTQNRIFFAVVLFALVLAIGISLISTSHAAAVRTDDSQIIQLEQQLAQAQQEIAALIITNSQLSQQLEQALMELNTEYILVLRHEELMLSGLFGDSIVVSSRIQEVGVSKATFDSCEIGDDITNSPHHRLLAAGTFCRTRVIVEDKRPR